MSKATQKFFESLKEVKDAVLEVAPGLKNIVPEVGAEMSRLGVQGSMEMASAIYNGSSFVPYGPGQYTPTPGEQPGIQGPDKQAEPEIKKEEPSRGLEM